PRATKASDSGSCHKTLTRSPRAASWRPRSSRSTIGMGCMLMPRQYEEFSLIRQRRLRHHKGRGFGEFDLVLAIHALEERAQREGAEVVHRHHQWCLYGLYHLHHTFQIHRKAAVYGDKQNVDVAYIVELLLRQGVVKMTQMSDAQASHVKDEDRITVSLGTANPIPDIGGNAAHM